MYLPRLFAVGKNKEFSFRKEPWAINGVIRLSNFRNLIPVPSECKSILDFPNLMHLPFLCLHSPHPEYPLHHPPTKITEISNLIPLAKLAFVSVVSILLFLSFSSSKRSVYTKIYQLITSPTELHLDQQFTNPDQLNLQVLASETTLENYVFGINVPSKFTRDATFTTES